MEELLGSKDEEPRTDVEQPHAEVPGVEISTQAVVKNFVFPPRFFSFT